MRTEYKLKIFGPFRDESDISASEIEQEVNNLLAKGWVLKTVSSPSFFRIGSFFQLSSIDFLLIYHFVREKEGEAETA